MRRAAVASLLVAIVACGTKPPPPPPAPPPAPLHLEPACDLVPAAGLEWIVEAKPRAIAEVPDLIPAIGLVIPEERFRMFTAAHGGIDLRQIQDLCVAHYRDALLTVARTPIDPIKVEKAFTDRSTRSPLRTFVLPNPPVFRLSGEVNGEAQQIILFGRDAVVLEEGRAGPIRAAEAFALGKLRRALPALRGAALRPAAEALGDAPVRVFAPGPFEGASAQGLGGLLRATTAIGASAKPLEKGRIGVRVVLTGAWGDDAPAAGERLAAAVHVVAESSVGRLFGLDKPIDGAPVVHHQRDALVLEMTLDGMTLARGAHDALDAEVTDILRGRQEPKKPSP